MHVFPLQDASPNLLAAAKAPWPSRFPSTTPPGKMDRCLWRAPSQVLNHRLIFLLSLLYEKVVLANHALVGHITSTDLNNLDKSGSYVGGIVLFILDLNLREHRRASKRTTETRIRLDQVQSWRPVKKFLLQLGNCLGSILAFCWQFADFLYVFHWFLAYVYISLTVPAPSAQSQTWRPNNYEGSKDNHSYSFEMGKKPKTSQNCFVKITSNWWTSAPICSHANLVMAGG